MKERFNFSDFIILMEVNDDNSLISFLFSTGGEDFSSVIPDVILNSEDKGDDDGLRNKGWSARIKLLNEEYRQIELSLNSTPLPYHLLLISADNKLVYSRLLKSNAIFRETIMVDVFNEKYVHITTFDKSTVFINNKGEETLKIDGIRGWTIKDEMSHFNEKPEVHSLFVTPFWLLARSEGRWGMFDKDLSLVRYLPEFLNYKVSGKRYGDYAQVSLRIDKTKSRQGTETVKTLLFYKDGSIISEIDNRTDGIRDYDVDAGIKYTTTNGWYNEKQNKTVFREGKYLFDVISNSGHRLFDDNELVIKCYVRSEEKPKFGVLNKQLQFIIPCIFDEVEILPNNHILYKIDNSFGLLSTSLKTILPRSFSEIYPMANFYITAKMGGFPNSFWSDIEDMKRGGRWSDDHGTPCECQVFDIHGNPTIDATFDNIYCPDFMYTKDGMYRPMSVCITQKSESIQFGIINKDGHFIVSPNHSYLDIICEKEVADNNNPKAFLFAEAQSTKILTESGRHRFVLIRGLFGLMNLAGVTVIPALFDDITVYGNYVRVRKDDKFGLYSIEGELLLEVKYTFINFLEVNKRTSFAVFNLGGTLNTEETGLGIADLDNWYAVGLKDFSNSPSYEYHDDSDVRKVRIDGGLWGYCNLLESIVGEPLYSEVHPFEDGSALIKLNSVYYLMGQDLKLIGEPQKQIIKYKTKLDNAEFERDDEGYSGDDGYDGYDQSDLDRMYRDAYEGDPEAIWNTD